MTINQAIQKTLLKLQPVSKRPILDSFLIIGYVLDVDKQFLILHPNSPINRSQWQKIKYYIKKRLAHTPLAYITHTKEFFGLDFYVNNQVLIPRPETEILVQRVIDLLQNDPSLKSVHDLGTGSGCIGISIKKSYPKADILLTDISLKALQVAKKNAIVHSVYTDIQLIHSDLLNYLKNKKSALKKPCDIIVANLPYLNKNRHKNDSITCEPNVALYSSQDGLDHYYRLLQDLQSHFLILPTYVLCEIGPYQAPKLIARAKQLFGLRVDIQTHKDLSHKNRIIEFKFKTTT